MGTFVEAHHPRGQADNAGQFRDKTNTDPEGALAPPDEAARAEPGRTWFQVLPERIPQVERAIENANRRLARNGVADRFSFTAKDSIFRDENGKPWVVSEVTLNRPTITVGDWQFVAAHELTAQGTIISHYAHGHDEVTVNGTVCDHCGTNRRRQKLYTVIDPATGKTMQVGSGCLQLFLGMKPEGLWALELEVIDPEHAFRGDDDGWAQTAERNAFDGDDLLLATMRQITKDGGEFTSRSRAGLYHTATIDKVLPDFSVLTEDAATTDERAEIEAITEWIENLDTSDNDYARNLKAGLTRDEDGHVVVSRKHAALVASAISSHRSHIARERERAIRQGLTDRKLKEFAFPPGEKLKGKNIRATIIGMRQGQDYGYGAPTHITLMDDAGHVFYWKSTGYLTRSVVGPDGATFTWSPVEGGEVIIAGGTVKENRVSEYNGDWETIIQRASLDPTPELVERWNAEGARADE